MSYYFVAALFPFFIFLAALIGFLPFTGFWDDIVNWIVRYLPPEAQSWVLLAVLGLTRGRMKFLSVGVLGTAWSASSGVTSLMESLNAAYEVRETRSYWKRRALAFLILLILSTLMILMLWVYIVSLIILVGAEVNCQLDKIKAEKSL